MTRRLQTVVTFEVRLVLPDSITIPMAQEYIRDAISNWSSGLDPQSPLFSIVVDGDQLVVKLKQKVTNYA